MHIIIHCNYYLIFVLSHIILYEDSMNIWKVLLVFSITGIIFFAAWWAKDGYQFYTKDKIEIITKVKDEIFGEEVEKREWIDKFSLGILPDDPHPTGIYRSLLFPVTLLTACALISVYRLKKQS